MDVGGGSFYIDCIETSNKFACLAEDDECAQPESQWGRMFACSDWTDWREYYSSIPAPPPTLTFANVTIAKKKQSRNKITKKTVSSAVDSENDYLPPPTTEWIKLNRKAQRNKDNAKKCHDECCGTLPVIGMVVKDPKATCDW